MLCYFVSEADAAEEHFIALGRKSIVKLLRIVAVLGTIDVMLAVTVLKAYKYVIRRLLACLFEPFGSDALNFFRLLLIGSCYVGRCQRDRLLHVPGVQKRRFANVVTRRNLFAFVKVGNVYYSRISKRSSPISLVVLGLLDNNMLKELYGAFKIVITKRTPSVSSVYYVHVAVGIDSPFASAEITNVIIALASYIAAT